MHDVVETRLIHGTRNVTVQQVYKLRSLALREVPAETRNKGALYKLGVAGTLLKRPETLLGSLGAARSQGLDKILDTHLVNNLLVVNSERLTSEHFFVLFTSSLNPLWVLFKQVFESEDF